MNLLSRGPCVAVFPSALGSGRNICVSPRTFAKPRTSFLVAFMPRLRAAVNNRSTPGAPSSALSSASCQRSSAISSLRKIATRGRRLPGG